jgi:hypothetical protein
VRHRIWHDAARGEFFGDVFADQERMVLSLLAYSIRLAFSRESGNGPCRKSNLNILMGIVICGHPIIAVGA